MLNIKYYIRIDYNNRIDTICMKGNIIISKPNRFLKDKKYILHSVNAPSIDDLYARIVRGLNKLAAIKYQYELDGDSFDYSILLSDLLLIHGDADFSFIRGSIANPEFNVIITVKDKKISDNKVKLVINYLNDDRWETYKDKIYYIDYPMNNCVDKFTTIHAKRLNEQIAENVEQLRNDCVNRNFEILQNNSSYHNTAQYEKDFNRLIKIRNDAKELYERTSKFLENLTDSKYTE